MIRAPAGIGSRAPRRMRLMNDKEQENVSSEDRGPGAGPARRVPEVRPRKEQHFSWIWLIPLLAVLVGGGLLARDWMSVGPTIVIAFESAEGIERSEEHTSELQS